MDKSIILLYILTLAANSQAVNKRDPVAAQDSFIPVAIQNRYFYTNKIQLISNDRNLTIMLQ